MTMRTSAGTAPIVNFAGVVASAIGAGASLMRGGHRSYEAEAAGENEVEEVAA